MTSKREPGVPLEFVKNYGEGETMATIWAVRLTEFGVTDTFGISLEQWHGSWAIVLYRHDNLPVASVFGQRESPENHREG